MGLKIVTLTGADDAISPSKLVELSKKFPMAEWGILYFPEKEGSARNPTPEWREKALSFDGLNLSAHLCGKQVFRELLNPHVRDARISDLRKYKRVQLNINARDQDFFDDEVIDVFRTLHKADIHIILQLHDRTKDVIAQFIAEVSPLKINLIDIIFDASQGKGTKPDAWPVPFAAAHKNIFCVFAGGLNPDNVEAELPKIHAVGTKWGDQPYGIDMETGVRTDNQFDLGKAERVLAITSAQHEAVS